MSERESRINVGDLKPGDIALLKDIAEAAAERAVKMTFIAMGLDPADPIAAQRDFSFLRDMTVRTRDPAFNDDMNWVRRTRVRWDGMLGKVLVGVFGIAALGGLHALWDGIKVALGRTSG